MQRITFRIQVYIGLAVLAVCIFLRHLLNNGIFLNAAWVIYGLLFLVHPVLPEAFEVESPQRLRQLRRQVRVAGGIAVVIGLVVRIGKGVDA